MKKLFTLIALLGMFCSGAWAETVGTLGAGDAWETRKHSTPIEVKQGQVLHYVFTNTSYGTAGWNHYLLEVTDGTGDFSVSGDVASTYYLTLRADKYGWGDAYDETTYTGSFDSNITNGATVDLYVCFDTDKKVRTYAYVANGANSYNWSNVSKVIEKTSVFVSLAEELAVLDITSANVKSGIVKWNVSSSASYTANQELSNAEDLVSVKLGDGAWKYNNGTYPGIQSTTELAFTDKIPTAGTYLVIKPVRDLEFKLTTGASNNYSTHLIEASNPSVDLGYNRPRYSQEVNFGKLSAGKTYYFYGDGYKNSGDLLRIQSFIVTAYEDYTINYCNEAGNAIKAPANRAGMYGATVTATAEDMARYDDGSAMYDYVSGNKNIVLGTENAINLIFEEVAAPATSYTVKFQLSDGTDIAEAIHHDAFVGDEVTVDPSEALTYIVYDGKKYKYASGNVPTTLVEDENSNVIILVYAEAPIYTYSITTNLDTEIASGSIYENDAAPTIYWHKYIEVGGKWYVTSSAYGLTVSNTQNTNQVVDYTEASGNIVYAASANSVNMSNSNSGSNSYTYCQTFTGTGFSNGFCGRLRANAYVYTDEVSIAGKYRVTVHYARGGNSTSASVNNVSIRSNNTNTVIGSWNISAAGDKVYEDIELLAGSSIAISVANNNSNWCLDYIVLERTGDLSYDKTTGTTGFITFSAVVPVTVPAGMKVYTSSISDATLTAEPTEDTVIPANIGVIVKGEPNTEYTFVQSATAGSDITTALTAAPNGVTGDGTNIYGLLKNSMEFAIVNSDVTLADNSAYLVYNASAGARLRMVVNGETDGIENVNADAKSNVTYNLAGQRVNANAKGIVIVNGKKLILR